MKKLFGAAIVAAMLIASAAVMAEEGETTTLNGQFIWEGGNSTGDLEAIFTPNGDDGWNVDFHFEFRGKPHVYSGTASGSLSEGKLEGRVLNENKKRTFTFEGSFEDGAFSGTHAEVNGDKASSTGTLTLN